MVGGANMIDKIKCKHRVGIDIHKQLIALFNALIWGGYEPPEHISEEEYNTVSKHKDDYLDYYVGLVGFCATFGAKYFGGYARGVKADKVTPRDIPNEALRNLKTQIPYIKDVEFYNMSYDEFDYNKITVPSVIYCDIPYQNTTKYSVSSFDYDKFWNWVREMSNTHFILVSEYNAPSDFRCVWSKKTTTSLKVHEHEDRVERLFTYSGGLYDQYIKNDSSQTA